MRHVWRRNTHGSFCGPKNAGTFPLSTTGSVMTIAFLIFDVCMHMIASSNVPLNSLHHMFLILATNHRPMSCLTFSAVIASNISSTWWVLSPISLSSSALPLSIASNGCDCGGWDSGCDDGRDGGDGGDCDDCCDDGCDDGWITILIGSVWLTIEFVWFEYDWIDWVLKSLIGFAF